MSDPIDFHIVLVADTNVNALRTLIAMTFGLSKYDGSDFDNAANDAPNLGLQVEWTEGLQARGGRLKFLFSADSEDARSGDNVVRGSGMLGSNLDISAGGTQSTIPNTPGPLTSTDASQITRHHHNVDATLRILPELMDTFVRRPERPGDASLLGAVQAVLPRSVRRASRILDIENPVIRIRFYIRQIQHGTDHPITEVLSTIKAEIGPDKVAKSQIDFAVINIWKNNPELPLAENRISLVDTVAAITKSLPNSPLQLRAPVPIVVATGELALPASLIGNRGTISDVLNLYFNDEAIADRILRDTWRDPISLVYSDEYLKGHLTEVLELDGMMEQVMQVKELKADIRLVPFDINGIDTANKTIASVYLPINPNVRSGLTVAELGHLRSSLFDEVAQSVFRKTRPGLDFWHNTHENWMPIRTSTILAAAISSRSSDLESQKSPHKISFWK
jgi:hypothetical protein